MGKRPVWLRQALEAGKTLDDFLISKAPGTRSTRSSSRPKRAGKQPVQSKSAPNKRSTAKKTVAKKRAKVAGGASTTD